MTGAMTAREVRNIGLLLNVPMFAGLSPEAMGPVAAAVVERRFEDGAVIFEEGEEGEELFVIAEGRVRVVREGQVLATLGPRECLGEMAVIDGGARSASAVAWGSVTLLAMARDRFEGLLALHPGLARGVLAVLARRLRAANAEG